MQRVVSACLSFFAFASTGGLSASGHAQWAEDQAPIADDRASTHVFGFPSLRTQPPLLLSSGDPVDRGSSQPNSSSVEESATEPERMDDRAVSSTGVRFEPGNGVNVTSSDGMFGFSLGARVQGQYALEREHDGDIEHELTVRRARIKIGGHAFSPDVRFAIQLAMSPSDLGIQGGEAARYSPMLDWYIELRHLRDLEVRVGQFMTAANNRGRVISSGNLELVDRSIMNAEFNLDRDVGVEIKSRNLFGAGLLAYRVGVFSGHGRDAHGLNALRLLYAARVDVTPFGHFEDYREVDFERGRPRLAFGGGYAYVDQGKRDRGSRGNVFEDGGTSSSHHAFGDFMFKWEGLSLMGEVAFRDGQRLAGGALDPMGSPMPITEPRNGLGLNVQAGYLMPFAPIGIAARYSTVRRGSDSSLTDQHEASAGLSYFFAQHAYKIQADYSRLWNEDMTAGADRVRLQLQLSL